MLKDRIISTADLLALDPDESPLLYVPSSWTGTIASIMSHADVPLYSRIWAILQFFDKSNWRKFILSCLVRILKSRGLDNMPFFVEASSIYESCRNNTRPWSDAKAYIEQWVAHFYYLHCQNTSDVDAKILARSVTALKWAFTDDDDDVFRYRFWLSVRDIRQIASLALIAQELMSVLDKHP